MEPFRRSDKKQPISASRLLPIIGFSTLSGFTGFGATYLVMAIIATVRYHNDTKYFDFLGECMPLLIAGSLIGLVIGLVISLRVAKADPETEQALEAKYIGDRGRLRIYFGAPLFVVVLTGPLFEHVMNRFGTQKGAYIALGIVLAIIGIGLFLYDHIPARFIVPLGIICWLLIVVAGIWFGLVKMS